MQQAAVASAVNFQLFLIGKTSPLLASSNLFTKSISSRPTKILTQSTATKQNLPGTLSSISTTSSSSKTIVLLRRKSLSSYSSTISSSAYYIRKISSSSFSSSSSSTKMLTISAQKSLFDTDINITVRGLPENERITVRNTVEYKHNIFQSSAVYISNENGTVDLSVDAAVEGGSYTDTNGQTLPGILDIYGTGGGLPQPRAALMASKGYAVLALAVFAFDDLPKDLKKGVDIEYFQAGIDWLASQPEVDQDAIGMIGCSFGAIISMMSAVYTPKVRRRLNTCSNDIKAVVSVNGFHKFDSLTPLNFQGKQIPTTSGDVSLKTPSPGGSLRYKVGKDDQCSPTEHSALTMIDRLRANRKDNYEFELYPDSGHLLEPPYIPHCHHSWHPVLGAYMQWGGTATGHNAAQVHMWRRIERFWAANLKEPMPMPEPEFD